MCCHNSENKLSEPVKSILKQNTDALCELIIVDNNCTDNTVQLATKIYSALETNISLKIVNEEIPGLVWARKKGFKVAKYKYLCFVDDDNIININWATNMFKIFSNNPNVGILGSSNKAVFENTTEPDWFAKVEGAYACNAQGKGFEDISHKRMYVYGAGLCIRKEILDSIYNLPLPLFLTGRRKNVLLSGDDSEICMRGILKGYKLYYSDLLTLGHIMPEERLNWGYWMKMAEGHNAAGIILRIYSHLIQGKKVNTRLDIFKELIDGWINYAKTYKFKNRKQVGSLSSITYARLLGRTKGFIFFFKEYNSIVHKIKEVLG